MRLKTKLLAAALSGAVFVSAHAQDSGFTENAGNVTNPTGSTIIVRDRVVSAAATALSLVYDVGDISQVLVVTATCSAGTATMTISGSSDQTNFLAIDSATAAATNTKQYNNSSTGGTLAVTPLAFRWVKVQVGSCGASNTSTLTVAGK